MANGDQNVEVENPLLGKLKVSGQNVNNLFTVAGFIILSLATAWIWQHNAEAKDLSKEIVKELKDNNKTVAEALKESTAAQNKILEKMADQQQRMVEALREANCLLALPQDRRTNSSEFCKRISR